MNASAPHRQLRLPRLAACCGWIGLVFLAGCGWPDPSSPRARLEALWVRDGHCLVLVPYAVPDEVAARTIRFGPETLESHRLYLRPSGDEADYVYIAADGAVERAGKPVGHLREQAELMLAEDRVTLFVDGRRIAGPSADWQILWETAEETPPPNASLLHPLVEVVDGFMRHELVAPPCHQAVGDIALAQHGGGMARDEDQARSFDFQRAVNPFTVRGQGGAFLLYGETNWAEYLAEARFYFGRPKTGPTVDTARLPVGSDLLVVQGSEGGLQVGFGWIGTEARFCLVARDGDGPWRILARHEGPRPPLTNWLRIGVSVRDGCRLEGWLDQRPVLSATLDQRVSGPARILVGEELAEFDDVRIVSLPPPPAPPQPLLAVSRSFAGKDEKDNADAQQFGQWAQGSDTFVRFLEAEDGRTAAGIRTRLPLIGAWEYQSRSYDERLGEIPGGRYRFQLLRADMDGPDTGPDVLLATVPARRDEQGWTVELPAWSERGPVGQLRFRHTPGGPFEIAAAGGWETVAPGPAGSVRFAILRERTDDGLIPPRPEHHRVLCHQLVNEFFEEAPVDWVWLDGAFRMDARWACQDEWNFLACGSTAIPMLVSKRRFAGEQVHEYFMSPRPVMPWDAGDDSFRYDAAADRANRFATLIANDGWYVRRDFNFSLCGDGRNPLSGYSLLFGAEDNQETRLLRRGEVVARTSDPAFRFPIKGGYAPMHHFWRRFTVWKQGPRLCVWMDGRPLFDFTDPEPLDGGHVAFWSVRNGFAITRVSSSAEEISWHPEVLSVPPAEEFSDGWKPLAVDELRVVEETGGTTTFARTVGAGFGAVRLTLPEPLPVASAPILDLPLAVPEDVALHLHVHTTAGSFLVPVTAPLDGMKALLTPEFERGECFRLPTLDEETLRQRYLVHEITFAEGRLHGDLGRGIARLRQGKAAEARILSLTLGNSSNQDYLLAGWQRNRAGSRFSVGQPRFLAEEPAP